MNIYFFQRRSQGLFPSLGVGPQAREKALGTRLYFEVTFSLALPSCIRKVPEETTTATPTKTSLENLSSRYFAIIPFRLTYCDRTIQQQNRWDSIQAIQMKNWPLYAHVFHKPWIWSFHVVVWPSTAKKCTKISNARAGLFFFPLNPIVLWRSSFRRRCRFLNSLIPATIRRLAVCTSQNPW